MHKIYPVEKVQILLSTEILLESRNIFFVADGLFSREKIAAQKMEKKSWFFSNFF